MHALCPGMHELETVVRHCGAVVAPRGAGQGPCLALPDPACTRWLVAWLRLRCGWTPQVHLLPFLDCADRTLVDRPHGAPQGSVVKLSKKKFFFKKKFFTQFQTE